MKFPWTIEFWFFLPVLWSDFFGITVAVLTIYLSGTKLPQPWLQALLGKASV